MTQTTQHPQIGPRARSSGLEHGGVRTVVSVRASGLQTGCHGLCQQAAALGQAGGEQAVYAQPGYVLGCQATF